MDSKWRIKRPFRFVAIALILGTVLFVADLSRFGAVCGRYALLAEQPPTDWEGPISTEALVVLTGDGVRIPMALELLRTRKSPHLLISGAGRGVTLTDIINKQGNAVVGIHETWKKITMESRSASTVENALESAKFVERHGISRIVLITSDYHMARSSKIFKEALPDIDLWEYPVPSLFTPVALSLDGYRWGGVWKLFVEYLKYRLYTLYILPHP